MEIFIMILDEHSILLRARAEGDGDEEGLVGDFAQEMREGESGWGVPYEIWRRHAPGAVRLADLQREAGFSG